MPLKLHTVLETLFYIPDEEQRHEVMRALNRACPENKALLQEFVNLKNAVALSHGKPNYTQYNLFNSLYGSAHEVDSLLKRSMQCYTPRLREYMEEAVEEKKKDGGDPWLNIWDEEFYMSRVVNHRRKLRITVWTAQGPHP